MNNMKPSRMESYGIPDSKTKFCVNCKFYKKTLWRGNRCRRVEKRDGVTGKPIRVSDDPVRSFRENTCKGSMYQERTN